MEAWKKKRFIINLGFGVFYYANGTRVEGYWNENLK
jgi:hypothetical protein